MEPVWKKALRKAYYKTGDFCNRPVPSVGCERSLAWCAVELYFYGMYYFVLIMLGIAVEPVRDHILEVCHIDPETKIWRTIQIAKTWVIIVVGELFFRANGLKAGWYMFCNMIKHFDAGQLTDGTLYTLGLERADYLAVIVGCLIVGIVGSMKEHGISVQKKMGELAVPVRWGLYYALIIGILIFAAYGDGYQIQDLIYAGF